MIPVMPGYGIATSPTEGISHLANRATGTTLLKSGHGHKKKGCASPSGEDRSLL
jgi:hypothetical protein